MLALNNSAMNNVWIAALLKTPPVICGRRLLPFSLFHSLILERIKNAYWRGGEIDAQSLAEAVDICSRTWEQNVAAFDKFNVRKLRRLAFYIVRKFGTADAKFKAYVLDYNASIPREMGEQGRDLASPWQFRLAMFLMGKGFSESEAWNMPVNRARAYYDTDAEMNGADDYVTEDQEAILDMTAEINALREAGKHDEADALKNKVQSMCNARNSK